MPKKTNPKRKIILAFSLIVLNLVIVSILGVTFLEIYNNKRTNADAQSNQIEKTFNKSKRIFFCQKVFNQINQTRIDNNLKPLEVNQKLTRASENKSNDILRYNYFSHINPTTGSKWSDFIKSEGYNYRNIGENLAIGYEKPETIIRDWMESDSHRKNILSPEFEESGISCKKINKDQNSYVVVHFFGN